MFAIMWAILAMLAAWASIALVFDATTRAGGLRAVSRAINAEPGRPGLRDRDLATRMQSYPPLNTVTVSAGSRHGTAVLVAAVVLMLLTAFTLISAGAYTATFATVSMLLSAYIAVRFGGCRQLRVDDQRVQLRRWRTRFDIPLDAVYGVGFVPAREPGVLGDGRIRLALWCDPAVVSGLPDSLTESVTVGEQVAWLRLDSVDAISTVQLLRLWQLFAARWTVGDENGVVHPAPQHDLAELFTRTDQLRFDDTSGQYYLDNAPVAHLVRRGLTPWQLWRKRLTRDSGKSPQSFEVRDSLLQTRWIVSKPDSAWKTAFYVTDRHGNRVGTLRATNVSSRNFDLCGIDNRVIATLRPAEPRSTVVDTHGADIAGWDRATGQLWTRLSDAAGVLCLLSPIVVRFAGPAPQPADDSDTVQLSAQTEPLTSPAAPSPPSGA